MIRFNANDGPSQVPVLYCVYREALSSVFDAMVLKPLSEIQSQGHPVELCLISGVGDQLRFSQRRRWKRMRQLMAERLGGSVHVLPAPPSRWQHLWSEAGMLRRLIRKMVQRHGRIVVHCRGARATQLALTVRGEDCRIPIVFDMRGVQHAEMLYDLGHRSLDEASGSEQKHIVAASEREQDVSVRSDAVLCLSHQMKKYAVEEHGIPRDKVSVAWTHVGMDAFDEARNQREQMRQSLGLSDRFVVIYCGSLYRRQRSEEGVALFKTIQSVRPNAHYLVCTGDPERMNRLLFNQGVEAKDATVLCVEHEQAPAYMAASDLGLITTGLWDEPTLSNRVCSPVKFGEYLASGLPLIMSDHIGDYSDLARQHDVGLVLRHDDRAMAASRVKVFLDAYDQNPSNLRKRCHAFASEHLSTVSQIGPVVSVYDHLAKNLS